MTKKHKTSFSCLPPVMSAGISLDELVALERHFGGIIRDVPRRRVSSHDPRTQAELKTGGMVGGDRMWHHGYGVHYARFLNELFPNRDEKITIVEIGILTGSGLALWSHLYPDADIIGLDIDVHNFKENYSILIERGAFLKKDPEIHEFDQFVDNREYLATILRDRKIDLLIDDGVHFNKAILMTALNVRDHLAEKFLYFIEDNDAVAQQLERIFFDGTCLSFGELTVIHSRDGKASTDAKRDDLFTRPE